MLLGPSASRVFVGEERYTHVWLAVCEYSGDGVKPNISWVLPDENTAIQPTTESKCDGIKVDVNSTFEFELSQYEGKNLTCLIQNKLGRDERRTMRVPKYCKLSQQQHKKKSILFADCHLLFVPLSYLIN